MGELFSLSSTRREFIGNILKSSGYLVSSALLPLHSVKAQPRKVGWKPLPGDFNGDGIVDLLDFVRFGGNFGLDNIVYDLDGDGDVDLTDFFEFSKRFGQHEVFALNFNETFKWKGYPYPIVIYFSSSLKKYYPQLLRNQRRPEESLIQRGSIEDIALRGVLENPLTSGGGVILLFSAEDVKKLHGLSPEEKRNFLSRYRFPLYALDLMRHGEGSSIDVLFQHSGKRKEGFDVYLQVRGTELIYKGRSYAPISISLNEFSGKYRFSSRNSATGDVLTLRVTDYINAGSNRLSVSADNTLTMPMIMGIRLYVGIAPDEGEYTGSLAKPAVHTIQRFTGELLLQELFRNGICYGIAGRW